MKPVSGTDTVLLFVHELGSSVFLSGKLLNDFHVKIWNVLYEFFLYGLSNTAVETVSAG